MDGPVAIITLNRPEVLNAITQALGADLHAALDQADADPTVRAIILAGAGRAFSSGVGPQGQETGSTVTLDACFRAV